MINKHHQKGAETVEFAMICLLLFALVFAVIEFGRALFVWNALTEATRRGARMAVICPYQSPIPTQVAIFDVIDGSLSTSPIVADLTPAMVNVSYLDKTGIATADQTLINFVQVTISGYTHTLIIPLWSRTLTTPSFTTTLYSESLGAIPAVAATTPACNF